ncbi:MAG: site-2 protease family protein, partial [candidate division KSB1 bacterium]|nr:site-2 protease family protein [candidate division KSB1 bacterium]
MITILAVIFVFGILIFVHELGHFLMAKLVGIRVERFSLGFPPRMIGKKIGDTDYCLSWIPLGGYVKLAGMIDESLDKNAIKGEPWEFQSKPIPVRFLAVIAGPAMNLLLAIFLFSALTFYSGIPKLEGPIVGEVESGKPAALAGLQAGDKILAIDGKRIQTWDEVVQIIHNSPEGKDLQIEWLREGQKYSVTVKPYFDEELKVNRIGMTPEYGVEKL